MFSIKFTLRYWATSGITGGCGFFQFSAELIVIDTCVSSLFELCFNLNLVSLRKLFRALQVCTWLHEIQDVAPSNQLYRSYLLYRLLSRFIHLCIHLTCTYSTTHIILHIQFVIPSNHELCMDIYSILHPHSRKTVSCPLHFPSKMIVKSQESILIELIERNREKKSPLTTPIRPWR